MKKFVGLSLLVLVIAVAFLSTLAVSYGKEPVSVVPEHRLDDQWWKDRFESQCERMAQGNVDLLMIGDSITHGWEGNHDLWNKYYAPRNAMNFGIGGDRTEHILWRLLNAPTDKISPKLAVIMIGTNNIGHGSSTPEETVLGIKKIIELMNEKFPQTKILLLEVFPRDANPGDRLREAVNKINEGLRKDCANLPGVELLGIGGRFLHDDGTLPVAIMPDLLHLNADGYAIWAEAIEPSVSKALPLKK